MAGLGSLTIDLAANITRFEKSLNRAEAIAQKRSKGIQRTFSRMASGLAVTLGGVGFVRLIDQSLDFADTLGKTADKLGISTDALQEYRFAAEQTGVQQAALDVGIQRFTRRLGEAQSGSGVLKDVIKDLGINLKDANGEFKTTDQVLGEYANAIKGAENSQQQLLLAFKAFDTEGAALVNLMRQGSEGINAFKAEAQSLGIVMDEQLIRNSEKANDQLNIMSRVLKIQMAEAAVALAPAITEVGTAFADLTKGDLNKLPTWAKDTALGFKSVGVAIDETGDAIGFLLGVLSLEVGFDTLDKIGAMWDLRKQKSGEAKQELSDYIARLTELNFLETAKTDIENADATGGGGIPNVVTGQTNDEMDADFAAYEKILSDAARAHTKWIKDKQATEQAFTDFTKSNDRAAFGEAVALLNALGSKHKGFALAAIALQKGLAIAEIFISTQAGAQKALEIYGPTPAGYAAAAHVETIGAIRMGLVAATGLAQASAINGGGSAAGAPGTAGADFNPITTSETEFDPNAGTQGTITINVNGVVTDEIMQDLIIPAIQDATNDRDVILFRTDSRQALELEA